MKVLVAVATRHNSTREIAEAIGDELQASGLEADVCEAGQVPGVVGYDAVVLGSAVYAGSWLPDARKFAKSHELALRTMPVWLFSSGPIGDEDPKPHGDPPEVSHLLVATQAIGHKVFAGKLDKLRLGVAERLMVKVVKAPEGDFRDWDDVREWARSVASSLAQVPTH